MTRFPARLLAAAAVALALSASPAAAETIRDDAPVGGVQGESAAKGYPSSLSVAITAPAGYERAMGYTGRMGNWIGPEYQVSGNPSLGNRTTVEWTLKIIRGASLKSVARAAGDMKLPQVSGKATTVAHRIGRRKLGSLKAYTAIDAERAPGARVQAAIAIDLGRRTSAVLLFHFGDPAVYDKSASGVRMTVKGKAAPAWNLAQAKAALARVHMEGNLALGSARATAKGRSVTGTVKDVAGHPGGDVYVALQEKAGSGWRDVAEARTSLTGGFSFAARAAGRYRVQAAHSGGRVATRTITVK